MPISAAEALDWGLVNEVVPADELRERATSGATELAYGPSLAFGKMRALLRDSWTNDLAKQLAAETAALKETGNTADAAEAIALLIRAHLEGLSRCCRYPQFTPAEGLRLCLGCGELSPEVSHVSSR